MPRKPYIGDSLETRADDVIDTKPNTDHVVPSWRPKTGKPTSLTPELIERVAGLVAGGVTIPVACAAVGIKKSLWGNWNRIAKEHDAEGYVPGFGEGESPYAAWYDAIVEAKAAFEANEILKISGHAKEWKASAYLLERRLPQYWQERKKAEITVKTAEQSAKEMSTEELEQAVRLALEEGEK